MIEPNYRNKLITLLEKPAKSKQMQMLGKCFRAKRLLIEIINFAETLVSKIFKANGGEKS